jgi:hypothetical protein
MRIARLRFKLRTMMIAVAVVGLMSGGYLGLLRYEPVLAQDVILQSVRARMAEADLQQAKGMREIAEIVFREETVRLAVGEHASVKALRAQLEKARSNETAAIVTCARARAAEWRGSWLLWFVRLVAARGV